MGSSEAGDTSMTESGVAMQANGMDLQSVGGAAAGDQSMNSFECGGTPTQADEEVKIDVHYH